MTYKRQKQEFLHNPKEGIYGDCSRTVLACLLNVPKEEIEHRHEEETIEELYAREDSYLKSKGAWRICIPFEGNLPLQDILDSGAHLAQGREYILMGMSANGTNHVVLCKGNKIVWDPAIDNSGIVGCCDSGRWWLEFIVGELNVDPT